MVTFSLTNNHFLICAASALKCQLPLSWSSVSREVLCAPITSISTGHAVSIQMCTAATTTVAIQLHFPNQHVLIKPPVVAMACGRSETEHLISCIMNCSLSNSYLNRFGQQTERDQPLVWAVCHSLRLSKQSFQVLAIYRGRVGARQRHHNSYTFLHFTESGTGMCHLDCTCANNNNNN